MSQRPEGVNHLDRPLELHIVFPSLQDCRDQLIDHIVGLQASLSLSSSPSTLDEAEGPCEKSSRGELRMGNLDGPAPGLESSACLSSALGAIMSHEPTSSVPLVSAEFMYVSRMQRKSKVSTDGIAWLKVPLHLAPKRVQR